MDHLLQRVDQGRGGLHQGCAFRVTLSPCCMLFLLGGSRIEGFSDVSPG